MKNLSTEPLSDSLQKMIRWATNLDRYGHHFGQRDIEELPVHIGENAHNTRTWTTLIKMAPRALHWYCKADYHVQSRYVSYYLPVDTKQPCPRDRFYDETWVRELGENGVLDGTTQSGHLCGRGVDPSAVRYVLSSQSKEVSGLLIDSLGVSYPNGHRLIENWDHPKTIPPVAVSEEKQQGWLTFLCCNYESIRAQLEEYVAIMSFLFWLFTSAWSRHRINPVLNLLSNCLGELINSAVWETGWDGLLSREREPLKQFQYGIDWQRLTTKFCADIHRRQVIV